MRQEKFFIGTLIVLFLLTAVGCGPDPFSRGEVEPQGSGGATEQGTTGEGSMTGETERSGATGTTETVVVSYGDEAYPILYERCSACHEEGRVASTTRFVLTGDPDADYDTIVALVDPDAPEESLLVQKGSGAVTHGGGQQLDEEETALIVEWIAQGALNN